MKTTRISLRKEIVNELTELHFENRFVRHADYRRRNTGIRGR